MSILGAVVRVRPEHLAAVVPRLSTLPGTDLAVNPGDGRLVLVLEDAESGGVVHSAAATLASIALWPEVLNTSLVYEYSGPDAPPAGGGAVEDYRAWRGSLKDWAGPAGGTPPAGT
jgi:nitrate reductase NapAB chaperone NapD